MPIRFPPDSWLRRRSFSASSALACVALLVAGCGGGTSSDAGSPPVIPGPPVDGPAWPGFARDAQHAAQSAIATQDLNRIAWSTTLDLAPQHSAGGALLIHYGSPVVTSHNTVVVPVKTGAGGGFRIEARSGTNGGLIWSDRQRLRAAAAQLGAELQPGAQRRESPLRARRGRQAADQAGRRRGQRHAADERLLRCERVRRQCRRIRCQRLHQHADHGRCPGQRLLRFHRQRRPTRPALPAASPASAPTAPAAGSLPPALPATWRSPRWR